MSRQLRIEAARNKLAATFEAYADCFWDIENASKEGDWDYLLECIDDTLHGLLKPEGVK